MGGIRAFLVEDDPMNEEMRITREMIDRARRNDPEALGLLLEAHRAALHVLAERRLGGRIAARIDASDLVQVTFLEAHRDFGRFLGQDGPELVAWLERILDHNIAAALRDHTYAKKRDLRRERPLEQVQVVGNRGRTRWEVGYTTPSQRAIRGESEARLERALATLPADQGEAVRLRYLENLPLAEIASRFGRSPAATAGLIKRGMQALRRRLRDPDEGASGA
jgi:RNA polymerase sigma-70 factor (ECF subfamily)